MDIFLYLLYSQRIESGQARLRSHPAIALPTWIKRPEANHDFGSSSAGGVAQLVRGRVSGFFYYTIWTSGAGRLESESLCFGGGIAARAANV